jgi:indolepyruvate ferredoxin oxidoreductase beta subunit
VVVVSNLQPVFPVGVLSKSFVYPDIQELQSAIQRLSGSAWFLNATDMAMALGSPIIANIIMLGALIGSSAVPLSIEEVEQEIRDTFPESTLDLNLQALDLGFQETKSRD